MHIRATLAPDTFIPKEFFCSNENVVDRSLQPTDEETAQHIASIGVSSRKKSHTASDDNAPDANPPHEYHFHSFYSRSNTTGHKNEPESDCEVPETP